MATKTTKTKNLLISPITQAWCDRKMLKSAKETALYSMATKGDVPPILIDVKLPPKTEGEEPQIKHVDVSKQDIGGADTFAQLPPGWGRLFPWPDPFIRFHSELLADHDPDFGIRTHLDSVIVDQIASHTKRADRVRFKKCLTIQCLREAVIKLGGYSAKSGRYENAFNEVDFDYYICVTSAKRIERGNLPDGVAWEDVEEYGDELYRDEYIGEYGRLTLKDGLCIVFLNTLDERMMHALMFGPDALMVTPIDGKLRTIFRRTPAGEMGTQPRGLDIGYEIKGFGSMADPAQCVVLEAEKAVE